MSPNTATSLLGLALQPAETPDTDSIRQNAASLLDEARGLKTDGPTMAAVQGCLRGLARLDLSVLQAHALLCYAQSPAWTAETIAKDLCIPTESVLHAIAELFQRSLILCPHEGQTLITIQGTTQAAIIIGCTSLAQAANLLGRKTR